MVFKGRHSVNENTVLPVTAVSIIWDNVANCCTFQV